jgi:hypothetical protein
MKYGEIMIYVMGEKKGNGKGELVIIEEKKFEVKGLWKKGEKKEKLG